MVFFNGIVGWLILCVRFLIWSFKRHWYLWLAAFGAFLIYRRLVGAN
jgi:hypothetical protein